MADARELILPLRPALIAVPAAPQHGVCAICHSSAGPGYPTCYRCHEAAHLDPPEVLPITLSVHGELIHNHLRSYKDSPSASVRDRMTMRLAGLLSIFLANHSDCLGPWDYATCIPSPQRDAPVAVVARIRALRHRYRIVLAAAPEAAHRTLDPTQFSVTAGVSGDRVLLLDDTFTTGGTLFSATAALRDRGAAVVEPLVIGRHIRRSWPPSSELLSWLEERPWSEDRCARCGGERQDNALF